MNTNTTVERIDRVSAAEARMSLFLLPSAPQELVTEVYWHLAQQLRATGENGADQRRSLDGLNAAYGAVMAGAPLASSEESEATATPDSAQEPPTASARRWTLWGFRKQQDITPPLVRSPWETLRLESDAPDEVIELAVAFWRERLRSGSGNGLDVSLEEIEQACREIRSEPSDIPSDGGGEDEEGTAAVDTVEEPSGDEEERSTAGVAVAEADDVGGDTAPRPRIQMAYRSVAARFAALGDWARSKAEERAERRSLASDGVDAAGTDDGTPGPEDTHVQPESRHLRDADVDEPRSDEALFNPASLRAASNIEDLNSASVAGAQEPESADSLAQDSRQEVEAEDEPDASVTEGASALPRRPEAAPAETEVAEESGSLDADREAAAPASSPSDVDPEGEQAHRSVRLEALARLVREPGSRDSGVAFLGQEPFSIGTEATCDVVVTSTKPGAGHVTARIWLQKDQFMLHSVRSERSVLVNGQAVVWAVLEDGDVLQIGDAALRFEQGQEGAAQAKSAEE